MRTIQTISIRQPWAQMILYPSKVRIFWEGRERPEVTEKRKDIENRSWAPKTFGPTLIHASKTVEPLPDIVTFEPKSFDNLRAPTNLSQIRRFDVRPPKEGEFEVGGIVGIAYLRTFRKRNIVSPWWTGLFGWLLQDAVALPFTPMTGQRGLFDVSIDSLTWEAEEKVKEYLEKYESQR